MWVVFGLAVLTAFVVSPRWVSRRTAGGVALACGLGNTAFVGLPMAEAFAGKAGMSLALVVDQLGSFLVLSLIAVPFAAHISGRHASLRMLVRRTVTSRRSWRWCSRSAPAGSCTRPWRSRCCSGWPTRSRRSRSPAWGGSCGCRRCGAARGWWRWGSATSSPSRRWWRSRSCGCWCRTSGCSNASPSLRPRWRRWSPPACSPPSTSWTRSSLRSCSGWACRCRC